VDQSALELLRRQHPAWQLLRAHHAPLVVSFVHSVFIVPNLRSIPQGELVEALEDWFYALQEKPGEEQYPRAPLDYLNEWAASDQSWLRKFYPHGSDEPHFDLTPATEKVISWLASLTEREFVGTESRLLTLFDLLKQMSHGSETDPQARLQELRKERDRIDAQMKRIRAGEVALLDDTELRDRFQQFQALARELQADFREVEHNFRLLDRDVREQITLWDGGKGQLLDKIMQDRDLITDSDQGKSFRAFWDFLMSRERQEELSTLLERMLALPAVAETRPDPRLRRVHHDWLESGEHTLRTVARLSQQLRRFLDDQAWVENRRILEILGGIEAQAIALRDSPPGGTLMELELPRAEVELPMERRLFSPPVRPVIADEPLQAGDSNLDATALFTHSLVDPARLTAQLHDALRDRAHISLSELVSEYPLRHGLSELVFYLQLAGEREGSLVDENRIDMIEWSAGETTRRASLPHVVFVRQP
jgi:hypothetical protein